ncbi:FAD-binding protein [Antribacter sp. KLBMP9083]|uniref:FAD-binding protein n=1 Tax=Antribacter soli TaxID=2910976 RepID=A0AA41QDQ5_9MICO|nr:D-arabinono-1,4-lactone oxidase [Antribacter soli]MCF4121283.1 FAD-binding protein [Antribacter soli]
MTLTNWNGNVTIAAEDAWTSVTSVDQIEALLAGTKVPLRALGSRFTYPMQLRCPDGTHGIVLDLPGRGVGEVRGDRLLVTGDTLLTDVWRVFADHGLEPAACPPVITRQTVAGALATGTHAQGLAGGTFSDAVTGIDLVDGTGTRHWLTPDDDGFDAAVLNLGCLGVVVAVELQGRPRTDVDCTRFTAPADALPEHYATWSRDSVAAKSWWFTEHDVAHTWVAHDGSWARPASVCGDSGDLDRVVARTRSQLMTDIGDGGGQTPAARTLEKFLAATDTRGTLQEIFHNGIPAPQLNMEIAVPLDAVPAAYARLNELLRSSATKLHYPVILRSTGPARGHLSPAHNGPVTYFGFVAYMTTDGHLTTARPLFDDIQRLLHTLGGWPHWGKYLSPDLLPAPTNGFAEFRTAVDRFDPDRRFANDTFYQALGLSDRAAVVSGGRHNG